MMIPGLKSYPGDFGTRQHAGQGRNAIAHMLAFLCTMGLGNSDMEQFLLFLNNRIGTDTTGAGLNLDLEDEVSVAYPESGYDCGR